MSGARLNSSQRGMVLVSSLLLLVVVTILAIGMFHSFGLDEKIAGNTREKQRALQAAVSAEQYAEWWLSIGNAVSNVTGSGMVTAPTSVQVCMNTLPSVLGGAANIAVLPWQRDFTTARVASTAPISSAITSSTRAFKPSSSKYSAILRSDLA